MSIRTRLVWLVLAVLAPTVFFAAYLAYSVYQSQWARVSQSMQETSRAVALAVDRDLARHEAIVATMAISPGLLRGNLRTFHERAREALAARNTSVTVFDPDGVPLLDTRLPYGEPLPMPPSLPRLLPGKGMDVSPVYRRRGDGVLSFIIHRPVHRDGELIYHLAMEFSTDSVRATLAEQNLPEGWLGVVLDQQQTIVARTRAAEEFVGQRANENIREKLGSNPGGDGVTESVTLDGEPVVTFYSRGRESAWTVLIALPKHELQASALAVVRLVVIGIVLVLAFAIALAVAFGRTITRPLNQLDKAAQAMARGEAIEAPRTGMDETDRTGRVLAEASREIEQHNAVMAERVAEAIATAERSHQALLQGQKLEALGRLTGGIAHDFNNLLQSMTVGLQLADMLATEPRAKKALEACQRSVQRGTRLTRQLMTFSRTRVDEGRAVDLRELILGMSDLLDGALPTRVRLTLELPEGDWTTRADPLQCELAVLNAALNSRDAMPEGGELRISLSATRLADGNRHDLPPGDYLELTVADTGSGMSEAVRARAFEPFFTTKPVGEGTGLGLAQIYGFARQSHGSVSIDSAAGAGTRLTLLLPRGLASAVVPPVPAAPGEAVNTQVLLVDDDEEVREVVAPLLRELGYRVDVAADAQSALERFHSANEPAIELLFSDIVMPGHLDGIGLAQVVRAEAPHLPIVLATGYTERAAGEFGFRVLPKPFSLDTLAVVLREELQRARA